ncbi:MAG: sugar nucleotide-binding protein [Candidatus Pacebacteria bacterium]|nr:sugar nucleotide-binding protein [Candidatus Paceibacterota bacterium]
MKKILLLGATGMLGSAIYDVLKDKYSLILSIRDKDKIDLLDKTYGGVKKHKIIEFDAALLYQDFLEKQGYPSNYLSNFLKEIGEVDYVINAIGVTIPFSLENQPLTFFINSAFPHILANKFGQKLIHITTDCVYNGKEGFPYDENSPKTPVDIYGLSKSLGEPTNCLTIRTSIIGRELEGFTGLLEWFLNQKEKSITGFANHFWNGITTKQFGKICDKIISHPEKYPKTGLYHVFSTTVSKYEMLLKFKEKYHIDCEIKKGEEQKLNRTLSTIYDFNERLNIPSFDKMIEEL